MTKTPNLLYPVPMLKAVTVIALLSLSACASEAEREARDREQFEKVVRAAKDVVCAKDQEAMAYALSSFAEEVTENGSITTRDGVNTDIIFDLVEDTDCEEY